MARVIKEHSARLNEILTVSQRLIYSKGYEQMTIQDILNELQISKGAFYHYFNSKGALLEALIERMMQEAEQVVLPIVDEPQLPALEKYQRFFDTLARWKTARKEYILAIMRGWYSDENAIVRQKLNSAVVQRIGPSLTVIIRQGVQEGVMNATYPEQVAGMILSIMMSFGDTIAGLFLPNGLDESKLALIESALAVYSDAVERILGAPRGSLKPIDEATLKEWFIEPDKMSVDPTVDVNDQKQSTILNQPALVLHPSI